MYSYETCILGSTRKESLLVGNSMLLLKSLSSFQETRRLEERIRFLEEE